MKSAQSSRAFSGVLPTMRSLMMSALAWEMAQPWPVNAASSMVPSSAKRTENVSSSPQEGFTPSWLQSASSIWYL